MIGLRRPRPFGLLAGLLAALLLAALVLAVPVRASASATTTVQATAELAVEVLSNSPDRLSGGDALVEVHLPEGSDPASVRVDVDGRDVTTAFAMRNGRFLGLVEGLPLGTSLLTVRLAAPAPGVRSSARLALTNHPMGGPVFSGPQLQPWLCTTVAQGLGQPVDAQCNAPARVDWFYVPASGGGLTAYDPANPPAEVAMTTTDAGVTVPFIVRRERGAMNRGIYDIAVLAIPGEPIAAWAPPAGWNGKAVWTFGPSAGTVHSQGSPQQVLSAGLLGAGFLVANSSLNTHGSNSNTVVSAEAVMMLKEHIVEGYGEIRFTIGQGGSGGAIGQHVVANTYPGLIDGLMPQLTFPDTWTTGMEVTDCMLTNNYFSPLTPSALRNAVTGHASTVPCLLWQIAFGGNTNPTTGCGLPAALVYHPVTNPTGVRCTPQDYAVNVWGIDPDTGFARNPSDNVGIQYGLRGLEQGQVTPEQFVALNEGIGSLDSDGVWQPQRREADPGSLDIAYRTGQVTDGAQLDLVPIIDLRASENSGIHTNYHTYALRERLVKANGHADNHVIFSTSAGSIPAAVNAEAFALMNAWLSTIEADTSDDPQEVKVVRHKPGGAVDTCFVGATRSTDPAFCTQNVPYFAVHRIVAGMPTTHDILKCHTMPLDRSSYSVAFTDAQWLRLRATFSSGVCDWSKPGVGERPSIPWLSYSGGPGGQPLPDPGFELARAHLDALVAAGGITAGLEAKVRHALDTAQAWLTLPNKQGPALSHLARAIHLLRWQADVVERGKPDQGDPLGLRELAQTIQDLYADRS